MTRLVTVALCALTLACSGIAVHVDLYTVAPPPGDRPVEQVAEALDDLREVELQLGRFFEQYVGLYDERIAAAQGVGADLEIEISTVSQQEARALQGDLEVLIGQALWNLESALQAASASLAADEPGERLTADARFQEAALLGASLLRRLDDQLQLEFSRDTAEGEVRAHRLTWELDLTAEQAARLNAELAPALTGSLSAAVAAVAAVEDLSANPDLLADDADPFLRELADDRAARHWRRDLHVQKASADGNAGYLIVRQTPTRYTIHKARSNPGALVKSQLRLARTGLQLLASVSGVPGVGGKQADGAKPGADGGSTVDPEPSVVDAVSTLRAEGDESQDVRARLERELTAIEARKAELSGDHDEARAELARLRGVLDGSADGVKLVQLRDSRSAVEAAAAQARATAALGRSRVGEIESELTELETLRAEALTVIPKLHREKVDVLQPALEQLPGQLQQARDDGDQEAIETLEQQLAEAQQRIDEVNNQIVAWDTRRQEAEARGAALNRDLVAARQERARADQALVAAETGVLDLLTEFDRLRVSAGLAADEDAWSAQSVRVEGLHGQLRDLAAELDALLLDVARELRAIGER